MDLLQNAATAWNTLLQYRYHIICGKSKKLYPMLLDFEAHEFYHLAGFPHMKDISFPVRFPQTKMLAKVLDGTITQQMIAKSENYERIVKPKLSAIIHLEHLLNNCSSVYLYNRQRLPFYTEIDAKYLLVDEQTQVVFLFTDTEDYGNTFFSRSAFVMESHDFRVNQSKMAVLQIKRTHRISGLEEVIYCKEGFTE